MRENSIVKATGVIDAECRNVNAVKSGRLQHAKVDKDGLPLHHLAHIMA